MFELVHDELLSAALGRRERSGADGGDGSGAGGSAAGGEGPAGGSSNLSSRSGSSAGSPPFDACVTASATEGSAGLSPRSPSGRICGGAAGLAAPAAGAGD